MTQVSSTSNFKKFRSTKRNHISTYRSWLFFFNVSLVCFIALAFIKFYYEHHLSPSQSGLNGMIHNPPIDVLFVGSSHTKQAIDIAKIEPIMKNKAYLLAYNGLDPTSIELILKELTSNAGSRFKLNILMIEVYVFASAREAKLADTKFFSQAPPTLKVEILNRLVRVKDEIQNFKQYYELVVSNNMAHIIFFPLFNPALDSIMYKGSYRSRFKEQINPESFAKVRSDAISYGASNTALNTSALESINEIVKIAKLNDLHLAFHETPMPKDVVEIPAVKSSMLELQDFIENQGIKYYNFGLDESFPTNNSEMFIDWNHLSSKGRDLYSQMLADRMKVDFNSAFNK